MQPTVTISHEKKLITSIFSGVMSAADLDDYFERFIQEIEAGAGYHELVDLTGVHKFEINHDDFQVFARKAADVFMSGRVAITEFIVVNDFQYGMARMFAGMADGGNVEFRFTRKD